MTDVKLRIPICSMYSIFTYMTGSFTYGVNVGKYSSTMEHMGNLDDLGIAPQIRIRN
jgi:hypothetical protein